MTRSVKQRREARLPIFNKISNIISAIGFVSEKDRTYSLSDHINYMLKAAETADPMMRGKLENHIVKLGKKAVPSLITALTETQGSTRGLIAMALIRIGTPSISYLEEISVENPELAWISEYITREIQGSQVKLQTLIEDNSLEAALVG